MVDQKNSQKNYCDIHKSNKKPKGSRELLNLASSINYERHGGERRKRSKGEFMKMISWNARGMNSFSKRSDIKGVIKHAKGDFLFI